MSANPMIQLMIQLNKSICDDVRENYLAGRASQSLVRKALVPDEEIRAEYDRAMELVFALTAANQRLRERNEELRGMLRLNEEER